MSYQEEQNLFYSNGRFDWKRFLKRLKHYWWGIAAGAVIAALAGYFIGMATYTPTYSASCTMVISNKSSVNGSTLTSGDIQASQQLAKICRYALTSDGVVEQLNRLLVSYHVTAESLEQIVSVTYLDNTNFVRIQATTENPEESFSFAYALAQAFPEKLKELGNADSVIIANMPVLPTQPDQNNFTKQLAIAGFGIGAIGVLLFLLIKEYFTDTVSSRSDVSKRLKIRLLGSIPVVQRKWWMKRKKSSNLVTDRTSSFVFIENFKALRTKLEISIKNDSTQCFLVTSTMAGEGKTTISTNLALTLAQAGKKVLLIDMDMRKPSVHTALGLDVGSGLTDVLQHGESWEKLIVTKHHLDVLRSGGCTNFSSELIGSPAMSSLLSQVRNAYDVVIIDSPPVHVVTDALVITRYVDSTILVVREDYASIPEISQVIDSLEDADAKLMGCILNRTQISEGGGYGRGYYRSYYGGYSSQNR
ncbi:MAG: polysaccharide biosynthesis tyrosine autokinase [Clostridiales bacterium]|nr:polysaccharide biosynthesis tyrosine autokinase [Clostridiales bacterium]